MIFGFPLTPPFVPWYTRTNLSIFLPIIRHLKGHKCVLGVTPEGLEEIEDFAIPSLTGGVEMEITTDGARWYGYEYDALFLTHSEPLVRQYWAAAATESHLPKHKKLLFLNHGVTEKDVLSFLKRGIGQVDYYCAPGPFHGQRAMEHYGIPAEKVAVTGWCKLDPLFDGTATREEACEVLGLDPQRKVVVYAPTHSNDMHSSVAGAFNQMKKLAKRNRKVQFLIRLHDFGPERAHYEAVNLPNWRVHPSNACGTYAIAAGDMLISDQSSMIFEFAAFPERPILAIKPPDTPHLERWAGNLERQHRHDVVVETPLEGLSEAFRELLHGPDPKCASRQVVSRFVHPYRDGLSGKRVAELALRG